MKPFSSAWYAHPTPGLLEPGTEVVIRAKAFVLAKWRERAKEIGSGEARDLSRSCKFSSLFAKMVFGGAIAGNDDHQFVTRKGKILDLNAEASDVTSLPNAYADEKGFVGNKHHHVSMKSCVPRVRRWVKEFVALEAAPKYPLSMTCDEAVDFLLDHKARNAHGLLEWQDAKQIANAAAVWTLVQVPMSEMPGAAYFPARQNRRRRMPGFALDCGDGQWDVLDGRNRVAEARWYKDQMIPMYTAKV
jgi:hypothetical protein